MGIDIVEISDLRASIEAGGETFLAKCFSPLESDKRPIESLAGVFAAKEAVIKALSLRVGCWRDIIVKNDEKGRPFVQLSDCPKTVISSDVSISHTKSVAVAQFVAILE